MLSGEPIEPISLASAYDLLNKTATLYLASGGDATLHWRFREPTYPVYSQKWVQIVHKTWKDGCGERESFDGRFVFALTLFTARDDERTRTWIGLGEQSRFIFEEDVEKLVKWHIEQCGMLEARVARHHSAEEIAKLNHLATVFGLAGQANASNSVVMPTFRAVLAIGRKEMSRSMPVLLVLTGHDDRMQSGPPTFDTIPSEEIISRRSQTIIEVSIYTAVRWLRALEVREEAVNDALRARNDGRRSAMYQDLVQEAEQEMHTARLNWSQRVPRSCRSRGQRKKNRIIDVRSFHDAFQTAWERIFNEERVLAILASSAEMRRNMQMESG